MDNDLFEAMERNTWSYLIQCLKKYEGVNRHGFRANGEEILCKTKEAAETLANFLEDIGFDKVLTGYYDPEEDKRNGTVDNNTGCWYVYPD